MSKQVCAIGVVAVLVSCWTADTQAQAAFQLSLFNPVQIVDEQETVAGVSLGLFYTVNSSMTGFNSSLVVNKVTGDVTGMQEGLVNLIDGRVTGVQSGLFNDVGRDFSGWQNGLINRNRGPLTRGVQIGLLNLSGEFRGFQMGIMNIADNLYGIQLGLVNLNNSGEPFRFLPIVNWSF